MADQRAILYVVGKVGRKNEKFNWLVIRTVHGPDEPSLALHGLPGMEAAYVIVSEYETVEGALESARAIASSELRKSQDAEAAGVIVLGHPDYPGIEWRGNAFADSRFQKGMITRAIEVFGLAFDKYEAEYKGGRGSITERNIAQGISDEVFENENYIPNDNQGIDIYLDPGSASPEIIADFYEALSELHKAFGGPGLEIVKGEVDVFEAEVA